MSAAALSRFLPKTFKAYYEITDPAAIDRRADEELPLEKVFADWTVGKNPAVHIAALKKLFDRGATIVNAHSGELGQHKVIDFYGRSVLAEFPSCERAPSLPIEQTALSAS